MLNELSSEQLLEGFEEIFELEEMGWEMTMQLNYERSHTYWCFDSISKQVRTINQVCIALAELRGEIKHDVSKRIKTIEEVLIEKEADLYGIGWEISEQIKSERKYTYWSLDSISELTRCLNQINIEIAVLKGEFN